MLFSILLQVPSGLYTGSLFGFKKHVSASIILAIFGSIRGFGIVAIFYFYQVSILLFFSWYIFINIIQLLILRYEVYKNFNINVRLSLSNFIKSFKNFKSFLTGMIILTTISVLLSQIDKFFLSKIITLELFSCFMIAYTITSGITRLSNPIFSTLTPYFIEAISTNNFSDIKEKLYLSGRLVSLISIPTLIIITYQSDEILNLWTSNNFIVDNSSDILKILCLATLLNLFSYPFLSLLIVKKKFTSLVFINFSLFIISLFILIPLINKYMILGAAIWWLLVCFTIFISYSYLFVKNFDINLFKYVFNVFITPLVISIIFNTFILMIDYSDMYLVRLIQIVLYLILNYIIILMLLKSYRQLLINFLLKTK